jgi:hypothetical protein
MQRAALVLATVLISGTAFAQGTKTCDVWTEARGKGQILLVFNQVNAARVAMLATDGLEVTLSGKGVAEGGGCSARDVPAQIAMRAPADAAAWVSSGFQHCASLAALAAGGNLRLTVYVSGKPDSFPGKPVKEQFLWRPGTSVRCEVSAKE